MSYYKVKIKPPAPFSKGGGFLTAAQIVSLISQTVEGVSEFYELEEAEVLEVLLDDADLPERNGRPDYTYFGSVRARMVHSESNTILEVDDDMDFLYRPLNLNNIQYPMVGEYVVIVSYLGQSFYTDMISHKSGINHNVEPGRSMPRLQPPKKEFEDDFTETLNIRQLRPKSGDQIYQGRYGNSIHFSSDDSGNPTIKIRAGQPDEIPSTPGEPVVENIALDKSSIWFDVNSIFVDSKHIAFGPKFGNQPMALGQNLVDVLGELVDEVNTLVSSLSSFAGNAPAITAAAVAPALAAATGAAFATLATSVTTQTPRINGITQKLETILSIEKNNTT